MSNNLEQIETQIRNLNERASPLRDLDEDDPHKVPLAQLVNEINRLRAIQDKEHREHPETATTPIEVPASLVEGADAVVVEAVKRPKRERWA